MGSNTAVEALKAKACAEKHFLEKNFVGAQKFALKARTLCQELEGISQMVATFGVYVASEAMINGELDFYSILGVDPSVEKPKLKKQYKKMAVLLHPDKNKTVGADGAFRLVAEAWTLLSDSAQRSAYDQRRNMFAHGRTDTFWTVCTSCHVQYEYLRKYVNKRLSCKNCRGIFIAVETGLAPPSSTYQYYMTENHRHGNHGCGVTYVPTTPGFGAPNVASGHHAGYRSEYVSNISFQGNSSGNSVGISDPSGLSSSSFIFYQANGEANQTKANGKHQSAKATSHVGSNGCIGLNEASKPRRGRPAKKMKVEPGSLNVNGYEEICANTSVEPKAANANGFWKPAAKLPSALETLTRRSNIAPPIDTRQLLIDKAKAEIRRKLEEKRLAAKAAAAEEAEKRKALAEADKSSGAGANKQPELKRTVSITVPDSDFHDFDRDRSEECFKPKQIWALYDEEDGMPRLYCIIRDIISLKPFKIYISYLSSKSDSEFGSVNWLDCGFTKSCGSFRVFHSETVEQVNIFSHLLAREKAGRGGCVRIYPRSGDIWAVYRNWSPDWNRSTPDEVRHQYEMVEVLDDYSEDNGVCVAPLIKVDGYKTVYRRNRDKDAIRWIPRREMLRFSHQVPSSSLEVTEGSNLPEGCWDLDPAATPDELLQGETELHNMTSPKIPEKPDEQNSAENRRLPEVNKRAEQEKIPGNPPQEQCRMEANELLQGETELHKTSPKIPEKPDEQSSAENRRQPEVNERAEHEKIPGNPPQEQCGMEATGQLPFVETGARS